VGVGPGIDLRSRAGDERERDAVDLGVFRVEHPGVVDGIPHPAQAAPHDLLAQQLRAEGAHPQDVRHGVGVPALGEHGDRDHALDALAEFARLADRVHHLA
jgi:hypothetical protein